MELLTCTVFHLIYVRNRYNCSWTPSEPHEPAAYIINKFNHNTCPASDQWGRWEATVGVTLNSEETWLSSCPQVSLLNSQRQWFFGGCCLDIILMVLINVKVMRRSLAVFLLTGSRNEMSSLPGCNCIFLFVCLDLWSPIGILNAHEYLAWRTIRWPHIKGEIEYPCTGKNCQGNKLLLKSTLGHLLFKVTYIRY